MQTSGSPERGAPRLLLLDLARCTAIALMVLAHVSDQLLAPAEWGTALGRSYAEIRGITAPLFFVVSGWSFSAATLPAWEAFSKLRSPLWRRLRRVAALFAWGYYLTLPWWAAGFPLGAAPELWAPFFAFGVLQTAGAALLAGHLLVLLSGSARRFAIACAAGALLVAGAAPVAQSWAASLLAQPLRGAFDANGVPGGFPLAPWVAYFLAGSALGAWSHLRAWRPAKVAVISAVIALPCLALARLVRPFFESALSTEAFWGASPSVFLQRFGIALALLSLAGAASLAIRRLPLVLSLPGKHALSFYVGHMVMLWGSPLTPGLVHVIAPELRLWQSALVALACLAVIWVMVWTWTKTLLLFARWRRVQRAAVTLASDIEPTE